jgi:hypothetical protein
VGVIDQPTIPDVLPAREPDIPSVLPARGPARRRHPRPAFGRSLWNFVRATLGWCWRIPIGTLLCLAPYLPGIIAFIPSILVVGWSYRWIQALVLRGWWRQSRLSEENTFEQFCFELGPDAPVVRPRWFMRERMGAALRHPGRDGKPPSSFRTLLRLLSLPWHSAWLNFKIGVQGLFCTYLLTGPGCLLMLIGWEFGWLNSFNKGYEQAFVGALTSLGGMALLLASLFYVPMAQVHQAATGDMRAFFEFRFVWRLIQASRFPYVILTGMLALASFFVVVYKTAPAFFDGFFDSWTYASDEQVRAYQYLYLLWCSLLGFVALLVTRLFAAFLYRFALLKVIREGWATAEELHPTLAGWLRRLEITPVRSHTESNLPGAVRFGMGSVTWWLAGMLGVLVLVVAVVATAGISWVAGLVVFTVWILGWLVFGILFLLQRGGLLSYVKFNDQRIIFGLLFWTWFGFLASVYVGQFLNYHPVSGFMNHPLIQFPCFNFVPNYSPPPPH